MTQIDNLPPLREIIKEYGLNAKKSLGQNFLLDLNLTSRIARTAGDLSQSSVIEVGPGPGGLTRAILANGAKHLTAIEMDSRCIEALSMVKAAYGERFDLIEGDALKLDFDSLIPEGSKAKVIANLPYNVGTALLLNWFGVIHKIDSMTLMFQKEVGLRICAKPGEKAYGRLAVISQWLCHCGIAFDVPASAFVPPPKVTSAIVHLVPREEPQFPADQKALETVVAAAFNQRRKMLRQSLKSLGVETAELLTQSGLEETLRAENVTVEQFCTLAKVYQNLKGD